MLIFCILNAWNVPALEGLANYNSGLVIHLSGLPEYLPQYFNVMAIHHVSILPKGFTALLISVCAVLSGQDATVAQVVHVEDGYEIIQTIVGTEGQCPQMEPPETHHLSRGRTPTW